MRLFKNLFFCCFAILFCSNTSLAQCPEGSVSLLTQEEVDNFIVLYPNCTELSASLYIGWTFFTSPTNDITDLSPLSQITSVTFSLKIENTILTNLNGLENLTYVGSDLLIENNNNLISLDGLGNLNSILGAMFIQDNDNLISLGDLGSLTSISGGAFIQNNDNLISLDGLENLTSIGNDLTLSHPLLIKNNDNLISLDALGNLTSLKELSIIDNNSLTNLSGLEGVTLIEYPYNVEIRGNDNLTSLIGLGNLTSVGGDLRIAGNSNLTSLIDLENLTSVGGDLSISNNPTLSICEAPIVCDYILNGDFIVIYNNAPGCNNTIEIATACSFGIIQTDVFYDANQNQTQDANEANYYDVAISIGNDLVYPQYGGLIFLESGTYTVAFDEANNPNWQLTTTPASYTLNLGTDDIETITFGIYPTQQISDIQPIISSPPARCNDTITFNVSTKNLGTTIANGIMWLTTDDESPVAAFIHQPDTTIANTNTYGWYFSDLFPSQSVEKQVDIQVPGPPDFILGNSIVFEVYVDFEDANGSQSSTPFIYETEVRCSYDPNDKLVNPSREGDYVLFEEDFIYTIRFQNTGNDVAYDVVIRDTLDANLDRSTFRVLGSSHADRLNTILNEDEGILTFEFRDIFLPDSTSNFDASQGYVNYLISPFDGLAEETPITNSAGIYFDLNPPVITNTTQSIMVSELPTVSTESPDSSFNFNVLPNPNSGIFTVQGIPTGTYQILNTSGQIIQTGEMKNDVLIDISRQAQGVYFISVTIDKESSVRRIVKM